MLHDLQRTFRAAVLGSEDGPLAAAVAAPQGTPSTRIDVYRNTVQASLIDVLAAAFPIVQRIVGGDYFTMLARAFATSQPPRAAHLSTYGGGFPSFIASRAGDHRLPYLADVARLEWARGESYFAADADLLDPATLVAAGAAIGERRFVLHPAARLVRSVFPIVTIWTANQPENEDISEIDMTTAEVALVSRPAMTVTTRQISDSDGVFVEQLAAGTTFSGAAEAALARDPSYDLQGALALHLRHGTFAAHG
jgi:hypothetical protein